MSARLALAAGALAGAALFAVVETGAGDAKPREARGKFLYEHRCIGCHASVRHVREDHKAQSMADLYGYVGHWARHEQLGWSDDDVADVSAFLASQYYRFNGR